MSRCKLNLRKVFFFYLEVLLINLNLIILGKRDILLKDGYVIKWLKNCCSMGEGWGGGGWLCKCYNLYIYIDLNNFGFLILDKCL